MVAMVTKKEIGGCTFDFRPLPPKIAMKILTRLTKLIGEPMGLFGDMLKGVSAKGGGKVSFSKVLNSKADADMVAKIAKAFTDRLDEDEVWDTITTVLSTVMIQSEKDVGTRVMKIDSDFTGRTGLMLNVFVEALRVNYADFFSGLLENLATEDPQDTTPDL